MFTGIIESVGNLVAIQAEGSNRILEVTTELEGAIKVDQSISHNGVCLTVTGISENEENGKKQYTVAAVQETLNKTNLGALSPGDALNIERALKVGQRLDGHFVQGHVDTVGKVLDIKNEEGSWTYTFQFPTEFFEFDGRKRLLLYQWGELNRLGLYRRSVFGCYHSLYP